MYLFDSYLNGTFSATLEQMETKEIIKSFKLHCFGNPSRNRDKLIQQFTLSMDKAMRKGNAFIRS